MDNRTNDPNLNRALAEREADPRRSRVDNALIVRGVSQTEQSSAPPTDPEEPPAVLRSNSSRQCWICFSTDEEDAENVWIQPCNCRGTTKWVHQVCLQIWVDKKLKDDGESAIPLCPLCRTDYLIYFPEMNVFARFLDQIDKLICNVCPYVIGCYAVGAVYWTALSYGAVTFLLVGDEESKIIMANIHPLLMLVTLPLTPGVIVILSMLKWEDALLNFSRKITQYVPLTRYILPNGLTNEVSTDRQISDGMNSTRVFAGAVFLPVAAQLCGHFLYSSVQSSFLRSLLGGLTFIGVKGLAIMYHKQQTYRRLSQRQILDYTEDNIQFIGNDTHTNNNVST